MKTIRMNSDIARNSAEAPIWARGPPVTSNYPPARITDNVTKNDQLSTLIQLNLFGGLKVKANLTSDMPTISSKILL